jgi:hypothetical protein
MGILFIKEHKFKKCPTNLTDHLIRLIHKGCKFNIVVKSGNVSNPLKYLTLIYRNKRQTKGMNNECSQLLKASSLHKYG